MKRGLRCRAYGSWRAAVDAPQKTARPTLMQKRFAVLASVLLLGGCSSANEWVEGKVEYKTSSTLPPLEVPPDLTSPTRDNRYQIPEPRSSATLSGYEAERRDTRGQAAASGVLPQFERMRVERAGGQRWLVVD